MTRPKLLTLEQVCELYPAIKPRTLRYWMANAYPRECSKAGQKYTLPGNGLGKAMVKIGKLTYFLEEPFNEWILSHLVEAA